MKQSIETQDLKVGLAEKRPSSITVEFLPQVQKAVPALDWLQFNFQGKYKENKIYEAKKLEFNTRHFRNIIEIYKKNWRIATIVNTPFSKVIPENTNLIKLDNRELYYMRPCERLITVGTAYNLRYKSCSRIDLAIDFNLFQDGTKPEDFIIDFFNNKYLKKGMSNYIIQGKQKITQVCHYLKFTSKKATISAYLYNKSKELREVKKKQYIIKNWQANGLDINKDIWRLEFSIHKSDFKITDLETGEVNEFNPLYIDNKIYMTYVLSALINKHWDFRINNEKTQMRRMKKYKFFTEFNDNCTMQYMNEDKDSNRADIIFINKLKDLNNEVREQNKHIQECTQSTIAYYALSRGLKKGNSGKYTNKI
jgi:hypothetical protein